MDPREIAGLVPFHQREGEYSSGSLCQQSASEEACTTRSFLSHPMMPGLVPEKNTCKHTYPVHICKSLVLMVPVRNWNERF
ncbi:hypothetical protein YC2023_005093 [Brassica napus]